MAERNRRTIPLGELEEGKPYIFRAVPKSRLAHLFGPSSLDDPRLCYVLSVNPLRLAIIGPRKQLTHTVIPDEYMSFNIYKPEPHSADFSYIFEKATNIDPAEDAILRSGFFPPDLGKRIDPTELIVGMSYYVDYANECGRGSFGYSVGRVRLTFLGFMIEPLVITGGHEPWNYNSENEHENNDDDIMLGYAVFAKDNGDQVKIFHWSENDLLEPESCLYDIFEINDDGTSILANNRKGLRERFVRAQRGNFMEPLQKKMSNNTFRRRRHLLGILKGGKRTRRRMRR